MVWINKYWKNILLTLVTVMIFLLVFEIVLRIFYPQPVLGSSNKLFAEYDQDFGWANVPSITGLQRYLEFKVNVSINSKGLRDKEYSYSKPFGVRRIAVLGDSFTWGHGIDQDARFSEVLETNLPNTEVLNFGVEGYGTDQEYLLLEKEVFKYNPDTVVFMFYVNDVENVINSRQYGKQKPKFEVNGSKLVITNRPVPHELQKQSAISKLDNFLLSHSHFYNLLFSARIKVTKFVKKLVFWKKLDLPNYILISSKDFNKDYTTGWNVTQQLFLQSKISVEKNNAEFVIVFIPAKIYVSEDSFNSELKFYGLNLSNYDIEKPSRIFQEFCAVNNARCIDLSKWFSTVKDPLELYYKMDPHLNEKGNSFVAEILQNEL